MTTDQLPLRPGTRGNFGFGALLGRESRKWWNTRRWWTQVLLWLALLTGFVGFGLFILPGIIDETNAAAEAAGAAEEIEMSGEDFKQEVAYSLFGLAGFMLPIGVIVLAQNQVYGEKASGVAAWILSKPVSRSSYLLAKLMADWVGILVVMVLLPLLPAYLLLHVTVSVSAAAFVQAAALLVLLLLFYHSLAFMMSVVGSSQEMVLGVPLGLFVGGMILTNPLSAVLGDLLLLTPWVLPNAIVGVASGQPLPPPLIINVVAVSLLTVLCLGVAFWQFRRQEL